MKGIHIDVKPDEGNEVCDFCSENHIHATYPCEDFVAEKVMGCEIASKGPWAACAICSGFIEREEWKNLLERSVRKFRRNYPEIPYLLVRQALGRHHELFRQHRKMAA
jgi:hypothetical protein